MHCLRLGISSNLLHSFDWQTFSVTIPNPERGHIRGRSIKGFEIFVILFSPKVFAVPPDTKWICPAFMPSLISCLYVCLLLNMMILSCSPAAVYPSIWPLPKITLRCIVIGRNRGSTRLGLIKFKHRWYVHHAYFRTTRAYRAERHFHPYIFIISFVFCNFIFLHIPSLTSWSTSFPYFNMRLTSNDSRFIPADSRFFVSHPIVIAQWSKPLEPSHRRSNLSCMLLSISYNSVHLWNFLFDVTAAWKFNREFSRRKLSFRRRHPFSYIPLWEIIILRL